MKRDPLARARKALLDRRRSLLRRHTDEMLREQELLDEETTDWEDRAANVTAARTLASLEEHERAQLEEVVSALARIQDGSYGRCIGCGAPIEEARLDTLPEARLCSRCVDGHVRAVG